MFRKECKKTLKTWTFWIYVAVLLLFGYTQLGTELAKIEPPQPGRESYGMKYVDDPGLIMNGAAACLAGEFAANAYIAYPPPFRFYKNVKLGDAKQAEMKAIVSQLTDSQPTYERFKELMKQADKLIGGGSKYAASDLIQFGQTSKTYEDALAEFNVILEKDRITGALARLFCDYLGIVLAFFPVFVAVALGMQDRRARMRELVYSRRASSLAVVFVRYAAMVAVMFLPVLALAGYATVLTAGDYAGYAIDRLAFIKYSLGWLLPTLMAAAAVGVLLTELTDSPVAIAAQALWWIIALNSGLTHMEGGYGADLMLRHNTIGNTEVFLANIGVLLVNRIGYTLLALALVAAASRIYELKRKGKLHGKNFGLANLFVHRKVQSEA